MPRGAIQEALGITPKISLINDKWNRKYAEKLVAKGPKSIKSMNLGTSFLVAPIYQHGE